MTNESLNMDKFLFLIVFFLRMIYNQKIDKFLTEIMRAIQWNAQCMEKNEKE